MSDIILNMSNIILFQKCLDTRDYTVIICTGNEGRGRDGNFNRFSYSGAAVDLVLGCGGHI